MTTLLVGDNSGCDITGTAEVYIDPGNGDYQYADTAGYNKFGEIDGDNGQGILFLDTDAIISEIGSGATISDVKIHFYTLTVDASPTGAYLNAYQMLTSPGGATPNLENVSYNERICDTDVQWNGDAQPEPEEDVDFDETGGPIFSQLMDDLSATTWEYFSSAALTALVQDWYDGVENNFGLLLLMGTMSVPKDFNRLIFWAGNYTTDTLRYYWEITYTAGGGGTAVAVSGAETPSGTVSRSISVLRGNTGAASFSGAVQRSIQVSHPTSGAIGLSAVVSRSLLVSRLVSGSAGLAGDGSQLLFSEYAATAAGALSFAGIVTQNRATTRALAGALSFSGNRQRASSLHRSKSGAVSPDGDTIEGYKEALYYGVRNP